jgi:hypothetical protein
MEALLDECGLVQSFVVAPIMSEYRMLVRSRELQLRDIRTTKILCFTCRQYLKSVWA